jgi:hypothetical protein
MLEPLIVSDNILDPETVHDDRHSEGWVSIEFAIKMEHRIKILEEGYNAAIGLIAIDRCGCCDGDGVMRCGKCNTAIDRYHSAIAALK